MKIFNGKHFAQNILDNKVKPFVENVGTTLGLSLRLDIIWIGDSPESEVYVSHKQQKAAEVGIQTRVHRFAQNVTTKKILILQKELNDNPEVTGYFIQLPIPKHLDKQKLFETINPSKDVDGLNPLNLGKLWQYQDAMIPATAAGVMRILKEAVGEDLEGKNIVIINDSIIVGKPLAALLLKQKATVSICTKHTLDLESFTKQADVIITATGVPGLITGDMIKDDVVLIDVGMKRCQVVNDTDLSTHSDKSELGRDDKKEYSLCGDIDFESCKAKALFITPVPGGVGLVTVVMLLKNVCEAHSAKGRLSQDLEIALEQARIP